MEFIPSRRKITIYLERKPIEVPSNVSIKEALILSGFSLSPFPDDGKIFVPCEVGGCMSCAMEVDGNLKPICVTQIRDGTKIKRVQNSGKFTPQRIVHGFQGHPAGG
jgi:predicted molibdopterin-dependent oxidoreductase YjgC